MRYLNDAVTVLTLAFAAGCGGLGQSPLAGSVDTPPDALGRQAINDKDWEAAIAVYKPLVEAGSTTYTDFMGLGVAYAGSVCVEVLDALFNPTGANSSCTFSVPEESSTGDAALDQIDWTIARLKLAADALALIPEEGRADPSIASSFSIHFALFNLLAAQKLQEKYTTLDNITIENLSVEDADSLVAFLEAGGSIEGVPGTEGISANIDEQLAQLDAMPGETTQEKVQAYMNQQKSGGGGGGS